MRTFGQGSFPQQILIKDRLAMQELSINFSDTFAKYGFINSS